MAKRVSVKGKGADIFFGDYDPVVQEPIASDHTSHTIDRPNPPATVSLQEDKVQKRTIARKQERLQARMQVSNNTVSPPEPLTDSPLTLDVLTSISQYVSKPATITNSFRYTDQELSRLTDAIYEITKRHGVKLSKQDVARLGLNVVLWDYHMRGDASLLGTFSMRKKRQRGDEEP